MHKNKLQVQYSRIPHLPTPGWLSYAQDPNPGPNTAGFPTFQHQADCPMHKTQILIQIQQDSPPSNTRLIVLCTRPKSWSKYSRIPRLPTPGWWQATWVLPCCQCPKGGKLGQRQILRIFFVTNFYNSIFRAVWGTENTEATALLI